MKVLVVGSGGREHAIIWKLSQSTKITKLYCAPGNGGISELAECVPIKATALTELADFAEREKIDLTVVGMDDPLVMGIVDVFEQRGLRVFGPNKSAARIEGSKSFSKELMKKYNIPTAAYETFSDYNNAVAYVENANLPLVVKADGLAAGKGVIICNTRDEAMQALDDMFLKKAFGSSGEIVVIEEFLTGPEVSVLSFCDGKTIVAMPGAQDHKRALDNDMGLNTGGMGTISPTRHYDKNAEKLCIEKIILPTVAALNSEGVIFKGIIFFGLMLTADGPKVIEYNCRFGDPETQVVLPRLKTDLLEIFEACIDGTLADISIEWSDEAACCVMLASGGYPLSYKSGYEISISPNLGDNIKLFHSGTKREDGKYYTAGGRVLGVTATAPDLDAAIKSAYEAVAGVSFTDMHFRHDIGIN